MKAPAELTHYSITDDDGLVIAPDWLEKAETVHRQLRPKLPANYAEKMARVFRGGGRMTVATRGEDVVGLALYRIFEDTMGGLRLYVDDLVTDENQRSTGIGAGLLAGLETIARATGCWVVQLDSGLQRERAHAFYLREGMKFVCKVFAKELG